ncbi:hypothetical protein [Chromobacterium haemolyticum]|uniref:hypothetical protein n=1 Tax=Chromobacterium haemolyticum TaxID=394935 RepID=UPI000DEF12C7|nr:hypothetical protein [Chromobacterium haemolyticum]
MITPEEATQRPYLPIEEITFGVPARSFAFDCSITSDECLPVVTEFALRLIHTCNGTTVEQLKQFFGYSDKETAAVIRTLREERLIQWNDERLELTAYATSRFQDSSDNLPRFTKIVDWSAEIAFDLISFHPLERGARRKRPRHMVELEQQDTEKKSNIKHWAEQSLYSHFGQIYKKGSAQVYKVSDITAGEGFFIPVTCQFQLDVESVPTVNREIGGEAFGQRESISHAMTEAINSQDSSDNGALREFIRRFTDVVMDAYVSQDRFDLRQYVMDVHLTQTRHYPTERVTPVLGSLHLESNRTRLLEMLTQAMEEVPTVSDTDPVPSGPHRAAGAGKACWLAPNDHLWSRSDRVKELVRKFNSVLNGSSKEVDDDANGIHVILQTEDMSMGATRRLRVQYEQISPHLFFTKPWLMDGDVELLLVPDRLVCVLYHFNLQRQPISVPIGFISRERHHLEIAQALIAKRFQNGNKVRALSGPSMPTQPSIDATTAFDFLLTQDT